MFPYSENMEFNLLIGDMLVFVTCKFEMAIFKIVQGMTETIRFAFHYVLSIYSLQIIKQRNNGSSIYRHQRKIGFSLYVSLPYK